MIFLNSNYFLKELSEPEIYKMEFSRQQPFKHCFKTTHMECYIYL
jgi:hypothetical protein